MGLKWPKKNTFLTSLHHLRQHVSTDSCSRSQILNLPSVRLGRNRDFVKVGYVFFPPVFNCPGLVTPTVMPQPSGGWLAEVEPDVGLLGEGLRTMSGDFLSYHWLRFSANLSVCSPWRG